MSDLRHFYVAVCVIRQTGDDNDANMTREIVEQSVVANSVSSSNLRACKYKDFVMTLLAHVVAWGRLT